jgi:hypothetical protein
MSKLSSLRGEAIRRGRIVAEIHPDHPTLRNPKFARAVFDSARHPKAWLHVAHRLRASADAIFERENPVATRFWDEFNRIARVAADGNSPPADFDESKFPWPNFDAAYMLMAYAIENLLRGLAVAKGRAAFSAQELPKALKGHDLHRLHQLAIPRATVVRHVLDHLTYMSEWRARYPLPTSIEKFWPMHVDGTMKGGSYSWPDFNVHTLAYYDALESELRDLA